MNADNDEHRDGSERVRDWVTRALAKRIANNSIAGADVEGIYETGKMIAELWQDALDKGPTFARCETHLIDTLTHIEHLLWHWESLRSTPGLEFLIDLGKDKLLEDDSD